MKINLIVSEVSMNKRQTKKKNKIIQSGYDLGFYHIPKYREIRELDRNYHEYLICCKHTERSMIV